MIDPRDMGAMCDACILREKRVGGPVPSEINPGCQVVAVGEAPGKEEVEVGRPFCLDDDTLVLMLDTTWRRLGDVCVGDKILTVEEAPHVAPGVSGRSARRWCVATVTRKFEFDRPCTRISTVDGELVGTPDHKVMADQRKLRNARVGVHRTWVRLGQLLVGNGPSARTSRLLFVGRPWVKVATYDMGWLAGFLDGEGCILGSKGGKRVSYLGHLGFSQNLGPVLRRGFVGTSTCINREDVGVRHVVDITTTAGTFIANGFVAHNCGESGREANHAFRVAGLERTDVSWLNATSCRPPNNEMDRVVDAVKRENKQRAKLAKAGTPFQPMLTPAMCCRPRLLNELASINCTNIVSLGGEGHRGILGLDRSDSAGGIMGVRGSPMVFDLSPDGKAYRYRDIERAFDEPERGRRYKYVPQLHPAFVLRQRRWTKVFRGDIAKAVRWFQGRTGWVTPPGLVRPSPEQLERYFFGGPPKPLYVLDIETEYYDRELARLGISRRMVNPSLQARIYCIGFHDGETSVNVPLLSIDGVSEFYFGEEKEEILSLMRRFLSDPTRMKGGWNAGYFDQCVIKRELGVAVAPLIDGILLHRSADPEMPHNLGFAASIYTDVTAWKGDNTGTEARTDEDLHAYNLIDVAATHRCYPDLSQAVEYRQQAGIVRFDHRMQEFCLGMHENGMYVYPDVRQRWDEKLRRDAYWCRRVCQQVLRRPKFNPGSADQVRDLLFDEWGLAPETYSKKTGKPSTGDDVIRAKLLKARGQKRDFLRALRWYRRKVKYRGTYVTKLRPSTDIIADTDYDEIMAGEDEVRSVFDMDDEDAASGMKRGCVLADGRVHPGWLAHTTPGGRFSSSDPMNAQNVPIILRVMFGPEPGHVYIYCDKDQLELRIVVSLSGAARYAEIFWNAYKLQKAGKEVDKLDPKFDPHSATSAMIFPAEWSVSSKESKKRIRDFCKRFQYAVAYGAELPTVYDVIVSTENRRGHLIYAKMDMAEVRMKYDTWCDANPEIVRWWSTVVDDYRKRGYAVEPILGRRCDFLDGLDGEKTENQLRNFPPQSAGASAVGLAMIDICDGLIPHRKWGPGTGLVNQCHDSLLFEVPEKDAEWARGVVQEAMNQEFPGRLSVPLTATAKIIRNWGAD